MIELDPKTKAVIDQAAEEASDELWAADPRGLCHVHWRIQKKILSEKYGIDWKTPKEMNPHVWYD